jgi:hypothetical protein
LLYKQCNGSFLKTLQRAAAGDNNSDADDNASSYDNGGVDKNTYDPNAPGYRGAQVPETYSGLEETVEEDLEGQSDKGDNMEPGCLETDGRSSHNCGDKPPHSLTGSDQWRKLVKVHRTTGVKPRAGDYEVAVKKVLGRAIPRYRGYLSTYSPYPSTMEEIRWAKKSWNDACEDCEVQVAPNNEIIKLVSDSDLVYVTLCTHLSQITSCSSHLRGRVKSKIQPHIKNLYGFYPVSRPRAVEHNVRLARKLKAKFAFVYAVCFFIFAYIFTKRIRVARNVEKTATKAFTGTRSFSKQSTPYGSTIRRTMA